MLGFILAKLASPLTKFTVGALCVVVLFGAIYLKGRTDGRSALLQQLAADQIEIYQDGRKIDDKVFSADDPALCALLGGCVMSNDTDGN